MSAVVKQTLSTLLPTWTNTVSYSYSTAEEGFIAGAAVDVLGPEQMQRSTWKSIVDEGQVRRCTSRQLQPQLREMLALPPDLFSTYAFVSASVDLIIG